MTRVIGADGSFADVTGHRGYIRTWTLSFPRAVSNVTAYGDITNQRNRTGLPDVNGSFSGVGDDDSGVSPGGFNSLGSDVTISVDAIGSSGYTITGQMTNVNPSSDKSGDAPITWEFVNGETGVSTEGW